MIKKIIILTGIISVSAAIFAALYFFLQPSLKKEVTLGWRKEFIPASVTGRGGIPDGWKMQGKPGTKRAVFSIEKNPAKGLSFLHMEANRASSSLITGVYGVDLKKTPILRWRWRATVLPEGADGRVRLKDDQAIGIYVGSGSPLNNKSVSYRWDTETPKGAEGNCAYGLGGIKVKWHTLRNREDAVAGMWFTEERNIAEDFKNAWGFYPDKVYLSISCNSQYTKSLAVADLGWIEFISASTD